MTATLLAGLIVAVAHHLMNYFVNGRPVDDVSLSQAWVTRFATSFASLVQVLFAATTGVAFVQHQWTAFARGSFEVGEVDSLTGVLGNVFNLFGSSVWLRNPILSIIAIITWPVPIAAIVTPGTLSVRPALGHNVTHIKVPQPYYNDSNYGGFMSLGYRTEAPALPKIGVTATYQGRILTSQSQYANQSYSLTFFRPAVQCGRANSSLIDTISSVVAYGMRHVDWSYRYLAWVGGDTHQLTNKSGYTLLSSQDLYDEVDEIPTETPRLFALFNNGGQENVAQNLTECVLHNSSYTVDFSFAFPANDVIIRSVENPEPLMPPAYAVPASGTFPDDSLALGSKVLAYVGVMAAWAGMMVGYVNSDGYMSCGVALQSNLWSSWSDPKVMARSVEQYFQNITLSMLIEPTFIKNETLAEPIPCRISFSQNVYVYKPRYLFLAYGLSFFCALACLLVGMYAFYINKSSYQNTFSTFLRSTRNQELLEVIDRDDNGRDPLPKALKHLKIGLGEN